MLKKIINSITKTHAKIYQVGCFCVCVVLCVQHFFEHNISKKILNQITNISCSLNNIDSNEEIIKNTISGDLQEILDRIKNNINLTDPQDLQLESYIFATAVEKLILDLSKTNHNFEALSIVVNDCPSTNWRTDGKRSSFNIYATNTELLLQMVNRGKYTRKQTQYFNQIRVIDYKSNNCKGHDMFLKNIDLHNLITVKNTKPFEHHLDYGVYWVLKFKNSDNFYIFSSPQSYQVDDKVRGITTNYHSSHRTYYKLSKNNFKKTSLYKYLLLRIHSDILDRFEK